MKKLLLITSVLSFLISCNNESCVDGLKNQEEENIDCGGPCEPCIIETCTDGIKNQGEIDIDCGGPCESCPIEYPATGTYGNNLLFGNDTLHLTIGDFSFAANIPVGSSLEMELELTSGSEWFYSNSTNGWVVSAFNGATQTFSLSEAGNFDLNFNLAYSADPNVIGGSFNIHYKENGTAITKTKVIIWD